MVEQLTPTTHAEAQAVIETVFTRHPMYPEAMAPEKTRDFTKLMFETASVDGQAFLHGIRRDGALVCVSLCVDGGAEPKGLQMLQFLWRGTRLVGPLALLQFVRGMGGKPTYDGPYLELAFLTTLPDAQGQGLGRELMQSLYIFAADKGYRGITLSVVKDTPAFPFYGKEGFAVDKEGALWGKALCFMHRDNAPPEAA